VAGQKTPDEEPDAVTSQDDRPSPPPPTADWRQAPSPWAEPPRSQDGPPPESPTEPDGTAPAPPETAAWQAAPSDTTNPWEAIPAPPESADPWRIPPQPPWNPAADPPPTAASGPYRAPAQQPPVSRFPAPPPSQPPATAFDLPPSATAPRSTPQPPSVPSAEPHAGSAPASVFDEPWRRQTPGRTDPRVRLRPILITVAVLAGAALVAWGVFVLLPDGRKARPSAGPAALLANRQFAGDPAATADGRDQSLTGIAANGSTVVAIGGDGDGSPVRPMFLVSTDAGRSFRLAGVQTLSRGEPPYGDLPRQIAAGNGAWVALGDRPAGTTVWTSRDGKSWIRQPDAAGSAFGRQDRIGRVVGLGAGFVAVGSTSANGDFSDPTPVIWRSADGRRWDRITGGQLNLPTADGDLALVGAAARGNTIIVHGLGRSGKHPIDGLWRSADGGRTWEIVSVPRPGGGGGYGVAATSSALFVAREAGDKSGRYAAVYASVDGHTWTSAGEIRLPGYDRLLRFNGAANGIAAVAATGRSATLVHSIDGASWQSAGDVPLPKGRVLGDVAQTAGQTILVGRDDANADADPMMIVRDGQGQDVPVSLAPAGAVRPDKAVDAIRVANRLVVAVGSTNGDPAVWTSADGRTWQRGRTLSEEGRQRLTSVTAGGAGLLAVGFDGAAPRRPLVLTSQDGSAWQAVGPTGVFLPSGKTALSTYAAAMGPAGYVIVGEDGFSAAAWFSSDLKTWQRGTAPSKNALEGSATTGRWMRAVEGGSFGYVAVGGLNDPAVHSGRPSRPAVWTSVDGRKWTLRQLPLPGGAIGAWFDHVSAKGSTLVATGTATAPSGTRAFAFTSADGGRSWREAPLPGGDAAHATVTAETATPRGFVIAGTTGDSGSVDVALWTSADGRGWTAAHPQGTGLSGRGDQRLTGLTSVGTDLIGVGLTADHTGGQPTLWRRPLP
jgi:hypothetical protein